MICPNCRSENTPDANFCLLCGTSLQGAPPRPLPAIGGAAGAGPSAPTEVIPVPAPRSEYIYGGPGAAPPIAGGPIPPPYGGPAAAGSAPAPPYGPPPVYRPAGPQPWQPAPTMLQPVARSNPALGVLAVTGALVLLLIGGLALFLAGAIQPARPPTATPAAGSLPAATPAVGGFRATTPQEQAILAAVDANNTAQIAALHNLDPQALTGKMAGQALADTQTQIRDLQGRGYYEDARLIQIDYAKPVFIAADQASIRTVEHWESVIKQLNTNQEITRSPADTLYELYHLSQQNGHWIVDQVDIQQQPPSTPGTQDQ